MSTALEIRFPLGRYHANPWDRAVNEGVTEWPPSPWRILRALISAWYTRWPDLPAPVLDRLLGGLADPPSYHVPAGTRGHTRHYLPDLAHSTGETGHTDLTLDPFLSVPAMEPVVVRWETDLDPEQREILAKLAELVPYLGRAESACETRLVSDDHVPDATWWRPGAEGAERTRLLAPGRPFSRPLLEVTTTEVRKARRTVPPGAIWVTYARDKPEPARAGLTRRDSTDVTAVRLALLGNVPLRATSAVLLADLLHRQAGKALERDNVPDGRRQLVMGTGGARTDHQHAHWIPVPDDGNPGSFCRNVLVWVPRGLRTEELRALLSVDWIGGKPGGADGYELPGFPAELHLRLQAAGPVEQVAPELCRPSKRWVSMTPYLPVRHRKNEPAEDYLVSDVAAELRYRPSLEATVTRVNRRFPGAGLTDHWASEFRRHRVTERRGGDNRRKAAWASRPGLGLELEFDREIPGPLALGQLSHFGFGLFTPM